MEKLALEKLRVRPFRKSDAKEIVKWVETEDIFYKWSAGMLGEYPINEQRMIDATSA